MAGGWRLVDVKGWRGMNLEEMADMVAADLRKSLEARAPALRDVYGFCLYADWDGYFLASIGTEAEFARVKALPAYATKPEVELRTWGGLRWSVGDWHRFPDDEFVTRETEEALSPVRSRLRDDAVGVDDPGFEAAGQDWLKIAFRALELATPLQLLPATHDAVAFVMFSDMTLAEDLNVVSRTVSAERMREVFPGVDLP